MACLCVVWCVGFLFALLRFDVVLVVVCVVVLCCVLLVVVVFVFACAACLVSWLF